MKAPPRNTREALAHELNGRNYEDFRDPIQQVAIITITNEETRHPGRPEEDPA